MASIKLAGDTSGEITISAPAVAGTNTISLQATTGTLATTDQSSIGVKNYLINGNFDVWQRGTSHSITSSQYTVDRWQLIFDGTPASGGTVTRQTFTLGQTDVPNNPKYYLQYDFPNVGTPSNYIRQSIEGVHNLAGQTATFSFWAKVPSGTMTISTQFQQEFGSGGSPSSGVYGIGSTNFTVTTSWQKFTMTTTLPSISGKTVGTNNNDKLNAAIIFPPSAAGTIHLAQAQVEAGDTATPFEVRPFDQELLRCQRYYEKSFKIDVAPSTSAINNGGSVVNSGNAYHYPANPTRNYSICTFYKVRKRAVPSVQRYSHTSTGAAVNHVFGVAYTSFTFNVNDGSETYFTGETSQTGANEIIMGWTAESEL